jgi:hypothetical protein
MFIHVEICHATFEECSLCETLWPAWAQCLHLACPLAAAHPHACFSKACSSAMHTTTESVGQQGTHTRAHIHTRTYTHTRTHTNTHTHTDTHIHIRTHALACTRCIDSADGLSPLFSVFVFFFFLSWHFPLSPRVLSPTHAHLTHLVQADDHTVTIADYAVRVQFPPKDTTKHEMKAYFEEWGPVGAW